MSAISGSFPPGKGQLLFAKSKVYIHVTSSKKDNVVGYLTIIKPYQGSPNLDLVVAYIPESDLEKEDKETLDYFDLYGLDGENTNFYGSGTQGSNSTKEGLSSSNLPQVKKFITRPKMSSLSSYAFGLTIANLFSIQVRAKTSSLWYGSVVLHPKDTLEKVPALFFHDDECPGTIREQKLKSESFSPFADNFNGGLYWGGDRFISCLRNYCVLEYSPLEKNMVLVNPTKEDSLNFIPNVVDSKDPLENATQSVDQLVTKAKWKVLTGLATITTFAKKQIGHVAENNRLPEPIKKMLQKPEVKLIGDEFDSANVYLARWALAVQHEAEKSRKLIIGNNYYHQLISSELGDNFGSLTPVELSKATRMKPISKIEWDNLFDSTGRLQVTVEEVKDRVFHGGLEDPVRKEAWLFLLGVFSWDTSSQEREQLAQSLENNYEEYNQNWRTDMERQQNDEFWKDQKVRIHKDIRRTDRELDIFKPTSAESDEEDDETFGNPHLLILRDILFSYNELNYNLGYVQGMSDLLSPLYYTIRDQSLTFWAFVNFMEPMERNFVKDLSGMKLQMLTLNELVQFMIPDLYVHLEKCDSNSLFFFFRMLLVWFKRELSFADTMRLWEVLWTNYYSSQFVIFFALAILEKNSKIIINTLNQFDQILKFMNDLSGHLELDDLLIRAELLFLKFRQMVELVDRRNANTGANALQESSQLAISKELRQLLSKDPVIHKEEPRTTDTPFG
ncbi:hypothetical protein OGAPHI_000319 [Ogataea philodendri]|uniref:Rab-GAP TBC domain-containing protein n=1 Tax=Ogataea philodendri TaxID=1378263 RepID=A0A9P8TAZ8_9ASCO|nr:uncharacterized protein OGAPHI_000319 [Ogataea philodendri]KAH3671616.1 hypothetical protein OGAPHI_000319 [Ogataea philodendri]